MHINLNLNRIKLAALFFDFTAGDGDDGVFSISPADAPALGIANDSLVFAEGRTARRDPLNNFYTYRDGWDIRNQHYWAVSAHLPSCHFFPNLLKKIHACKSCIDVPCLSFSNPPEF